MSDELYPPNPRGTHVSGKDLSQGKVTYSWWEPEVQYTWALGPAMSKFLSELKEGRIVGRLCRKCRRTLVPPRMFCEKCYGPTDEWVPIKDTGTVQTFSISYIDSDAREIKEPILIGVIALDGASPKHGIMHYFGGMKPEELHIGMKVKAVWKDPSEREGSIRDILFFGPLEERPKKSAAKKGGGKR